ncbi:rhodanese-related thiosulfate sulfurtransferase [alpha proteobacterium U9-1i]|nr:rhodanese-related thiosulfate sulfurtransferase [alpha proteobacterium U9-1i]
MWRNVLAALALIGVATVPLATAQGKAEPRNAQIDYAGFTSLADEVDYYRQQRLISLPIFQRMAREPNTVILDARSANAYAMGHIEGAINLPFTDFTDQSLRAALADPNTRILIYCNNNFENNRAPVVLKRVELALNIQTFINLYGYGYRNVYELADVVNFNDPAVRWVSSAG